MLFESDEKLYNVIGKNIKRYRISAFPANKSGRRCRSEDWEEDD